MTFTTDTQTNVPALQPVTFDLYRDIHKGIRAELFAVTHEAGRVDPSCAADRADLARHVRSVVDLLVKHAEHEDAHVQPIIERELPDLAERIAADHESFDTRIVEIACLAEVVTSNRFDSHEVYIELASFVSSYLAHQDLEERVVMPALDALLGIDGLLAVHGAIIGSIPPDEMARTLAVMLPAMNVDDRTDLLGGMKAGAPAEVFAAVWSLAGSVLTTAERDAVAHRLGL